MDPTTQTIEELMFHGRYHIIGAIFFLIFFGVFIRESIREIMGTRAHDRGRVRRVAFGPLLTDPRLGHTMTDGGEPMADAGSPEHPAP